MFGFSFSEITLSLLVAILCLKPQDIKYFGEKLLKIKNLSDDIQTLEIDRLDKSHDEQKHQNDD